MKNKKIQVSILILLFSSLSLLSAQGWRKGGQRGPGPGFRRGPLFGNLALLKDKLNLSDDQLKKISDTNLQFKKKFLDIKEKLSPLGIELRKLLLEDQVDLDKVKSILQKMANLKVEIRMNRIRQRLTIEKFLSKKQRALLRSFKTRRYRGMGPGGF